MKLPSKLPFSQKEYLQFFPLSSLGETCVLSFTSVLEADPKNIFSYLRDVENYIGHVLDVLLFDKHQYTHQMFGLYIYLAGLCNIFFVP